MRFRFCGDLDAPDWLLSEIATLSKISSVRIKIVVKQVLLHLLEGQIDYEKVLKMIKETLSDYSDVKGAIAGLTFILSNAAKYDVDEQTLLQEIQQLGMPKENSEALARPFKEAKTALRARFASDTYHLPKLVSLDWRVDHLVSSSQQLDLNEPSIQLKLAVNEHPQKSLGRLSQDGEGEGAEGDRSSREVSSIYGIRLSVDKFLVLHHELTEARDRLASLGR